MVVTTLGPSITAENVPPHLTNVGDEPFSLDFDPIASRFRRSPKS